MVGGVPQDLVDETRDALSSVVRRRLPPGRWDAVHQAISEINAASETADAEALRRGLDALSEGQGATRDAALESRGIAAAPPPAFDAAKGGRRSSRTPVIVAVFVLALAALGLMAALVLGLGDDGKRSVPPRATTGATSPPDTSTAANPSTTQFPSTTTTTSAAGEVNPPNTRGGWATPLIIVGLAAVVSVVIAAIAVQRWRRPSADVPEHAVRLGFVATPPALPAPREIIEFANRTVLSLNALGGDFGGAGSH